jgi:hypothetical protein
MTDARRGVSEKFELFGEDQIARNERLEQCKIKILKNPLTLTLRHS